MILLLTLLFFKHYVVDFILQTDDMVAHKGIYGDPIGIDHSLYHAMATLMILMLFTFPIWALILALLDGLLHYHIDYVKMAYGNRDIKTKAFWNQLGLDQFLHALTYIFIVSIV